MTYNEEQQAVLAERAARRERFIAGNGSRMDAERKRLVAQAAERYEKLAAEQAAEAERAATAAHETALREKLRLAYIAAAGSEQGFSDAYPSLRQQFVEAQALAAATGAKSVQPVDVAKRTLKLRYGG